jgi:hypothetical protein
LAIRHRAVLECFAPQQRRSGVSSHCLKPAIRVNQEFSIFKTTESPVPCAHYLEPVAVLPPLPECIRGDRQSVSHLMSNTPPMFSRAISII